MQHNLPMTGPRPPGSPPAGASTDPDAATASKAAWRERLRAARREVVARQGEAGRRLQGERLAQVMLAWMRSYAVTRGREGPAGLTVTAYEQLRTEPPLDAFVAAARSQGLRVLVPITLGLQDRLLDWRDSADPQQRPLGRQVLAEVDVAWLPGLAVDRRGVRLGKGGGYYDTALPLLPPGTPRIVVLHDHELVDALPADPHDAPVDGVVTAASGVVPVGPGAGGSVRLPAPG